MLFLIHDSVSTHSELVDERSDVEPQRRLLTLDGTLQQQRVRLHQNTLHHDLCWENTSSVFQQTPSIDHRNTFNNKIHKNVSQLEAKISKWTPGSFSSPGQGSLLHQLLSDQPTRLHTVQYDGAPQLLPGRPLQHPLLILHVVQPELEMLLGDIIGLSQSL